MADKDTIQALKDNLATLRGMDGDLRRAMGSIEKKEFIFLLSDGTWDKANPKQGFEYEIYRLRDDYCPEPEIVECEVKMVGDVLRYNDPTEGEDTMIMCAPAKVDFIVFKYEDGLVRSTPRMYETYIGKGGVSAITDINYVDGDKVLTPTHCLFRRDK